MITKINPLYNWLAESFAWRLRSAMSALLLERPLIWLQISP